MISWTPLVHPLPTEIGSLWMLLPMTLIVAVVYKTLRQDRLERLGLSILFSTLYILAGAVGLMVGLYLFVRLV